MLLDEDPATLIHHTIGNFNIAPDRAAVSRIQESLTALHQARDMRTQEAAARLKKLSRTHNVLASQHADAVAGRSSSAHASQIVELDTQKFRIAKAASELEIEGGRLTADLDRLRHRLQQLDIQGVEGDDATRARREAEDPTVLKLKFYRSLGIDAEPDQQGAYHKAVIRNNAKGDVHVVKIDPKFSRFFYADYFWSNI